MPVIMITTQEDLDELVETKVRAVLARPSAKKRPAKRWMPRFLELLRSSGNVSAAIDQLREEGGPCRSTIYRARDDYPEFSSEWDDAVVGWWEP